MGCVVLEIFKKMFDFYCTGFDGGFKLRQMNLVWKLARMAKVEDPALLYWSIPAINRAIAQVVSLCTSIDTINTPEVQKFLNKLYEYRSKIELDPPLKKGLKDTRLIRVGQRFRIVLPNYGIFTSVVISNEGALTITYPEPVKDQYRCFDWKGKKVTIYFWRKNDAGYNFSTNVRGIGYYKGRSVIYLEYCNQLHRTQQRKSIRCPCSISAELFLLYNLSSTDLTVPETAKGIKCMLDDLSEDGALIRIGGKGQDGMLLKLQFKLGDNTIVMAGEVKSVEYNEKLNQSRLHFQCSSIQEATKQIISLYIYSVIPQEQKEEFDAISLMEEDQKEGIVQDASISFE